MPHLGNGVCTLKDHDHVSLSNDVSYPARPTLHSYISTRGLVLGFISISHALTYTITVKFMEVGFGQNSAILPYSSLCVTDVTSYTHCL